MSRTHNTNRKHKASRARGLASIVFLLVALMQGPFTRISLCSASPVEAREAAGASARDLPVQTLPPLDYGRTGTVTVELQAARPDGAPADALFEVFTVALAKRDPSLGDVYVTSEAFEQIGIDGLDPAETAGRDLAERLQAHAVANGVHGDCIAVDAWGRAVYRAPGLGLYLIAETSESADAEATAPFLVSVPYWDGTGLVYDVTANPKMGIVVPPDASAGEEEGQGPVPGDEEPGYHDAPEDDGAGRNTADSRDELPPESGSFIRGLRDVLLPQTGQEWRLVAILVGTGLALLCAGALLGRRRQKEPRRLF